MGSRIVGAGKTVALTVKTSGIDDGEAAEIQVFKSKDNSSLDTLSSKVKNKVISADWVAKGPDPEGEEESWEVYYKAKCKGLETKASKLVVYCDWVEVSSVDEEGSALPDATFRVIAGQETRERNTGSSGIRKEEYLPFGPIKVEWLKPYHLVEWVDEKGPKRKAKVKKIPTAVLVSPKKGTHTQYVNAPADEAFPELGHTLKVKVSLEGGKAGDKVFAKLAPGDKNSKRNDPKPEIVGGTTAPWCPDGGIETELAGDAGTPDCEAVIELELGLAGGDVFVLSVGGSDECADESLTITNWRRVFYQVTRSADSQLPDPALMKASLADVYIEYDQYHEAIVADGDVPAGSFMSANDLGRGSGKLLVVGNHNLDQLKSKFQDDKTPIGAHVIVCDAQYDGGEPGSFHEQTLVAEAEFAKKTLTIDEPDLYDVFATAIQNGQSSVQSGSTWESLAPSGHADAGKQGDLTADMVVFGVGKTPDKAQVVLPPEAAAITAGGNKVKLTLKLLVARGPFLGEATEKHQLIVRLPNDAAMNGVFVHELGHALKQALAEVAPGMVEADHGRTYTEHGHQGHHCANGLSDADFAEADYTFKTGGCVMFGGGATEEGPANDGKFCDKCRPFVLAEACDVVNSDGGKLVVAPTEVEESTDAGAAGPTPTYRVTLTLGSFDELCDPADTPAGRQQRAQMLGLFYEPLDSSDLQTRWGHAWTHYRNVLAAGGADEATAQQALVDGLGKNIVKVAGAADDAASALPGANPPEFARILLPGGFLLRPNERSALAGRPTQGPGHRQRYAAEEQFYAANWRVGAIPIIAKVEVQAPGTEDWSAAPNVNVHLQLAAPGVPPDGSPALAPALRTASRVRGSTGPSGYVTTQLAAEPAVAGDPQVDNCTVTRGGKRRPGAGQAADYFDLTERAGWNTANGQPRFPVPQASRHPLAVAVTTNAEGEAGVLFRPSRQGGDRFKLRAFVDPMGSTPSDGTGADAGVVETGTFVVWRTMRVSKYVVFDYSSSATTNDRDSAGGALQTIAFTDIANDFANCYMELIVERTAARSAHVIGDSLWQEATRHAQRNTRERPPRVVKRFDPQALFSATGGTAGLIELQQPGPYESAKRAGYDSIALTATYLQENRDTDWALMLAEFMEHFMDYFTHRALSGITVVQAPRGDAITHATDGGVEMTTSGQVTLRRGCYVFYGTRGYTQVVPYPIARNALHEIGHAMYLPHQWTTRHDVISLSAASTGTFVKQETVQGSTSGATGVIGEVRSRALHIAPLASGATRFVRGETVTGARSSATGTVGGFDTGAVGGGVAAEHDFQDYCILSYQRNVRNDYDFCGRCNLKLRGWDTSDIPLNR